MTRESARLQPAASAPSRRARLAVAAVLCAVLVACVGVPFLRYVPKEELVKTSLWGLAVLAAFSGWGTALARVCWPTERVSIALRAVWGASLFAFAGGLLASAGLLLRSFLLGFVAVGVILQGHDWVARRDALAFGLRARARASRLHPPLAAVALFLAVVVVVHYFGGAADTSSNPYDDDVAYYPFAKQLLDRGTLIDPFSFRRMSTLGGQALYHALLLTRVPVLNLNVFDRAMCVLLTAGLLLTQRVDGKRVPLVARLVSIVFLVTLPNTSINSASYYSGLAFFLALYQTLERMPDALATDLRSAIRRTLPLALVGAALCTLRQNYQLCVAAFFVISYGFAIARAHCKRPMRELLVEPATALVLTALLVLPWLVLLYRSNLTFLFPIMKGTFRPGVDTRSQVLTIGKFVRFFNDCWFGPAPIQTLPLFMLVGLFVRESSPRKVLASHWVSGFIGLALLAWSFSLADAGNLARYDYGFFTASAFATWQVVAAKTRLRPGAGVGALLPGAVLVFALLYPLQTNTKDTKRMLDTRLRDIDELLRRTVPMQAEPPIAGAYHRMQDATPPGSRMLIMLDRPYYLDYARNEIWNLDMPGTASLPPGIPCFLGPEAVADYLLSKDIRYLAFVESEHSTFLYRHEIWFDHIFDPDEIWRVYAPYITDVMDNLAELAKTRKHLHQEAGMVLLDLQAKQ